MKRPSFQFYPGDWSANPNLKRCSFAEKGVWLEVMCLMHDQEEYGVLRWTLREIAEAVKCKPADLAALVRKGVMKGDDAALVTAYVYVPRSGRKDGDPVTLIEAQDGPLWYSSRMVKDEYVRTIRADGSGNGPSPKAAPKASPKPPIGEGIGEPIGGGLGPRGSSSSSSASLNTSEAKASGASAPPTSRDLVFANGVTLLTAAGVTDKNARSFLAAQCKAHGEDAVRVALDRCAAERPIEPVPWLVQSLGPVNGATKPRKTDALMAGNIAAVQLAFQRRGTT